MTVYADVLLAVNFVVDFLVLAIAQKLAKANAKTARNIAGAAVGAIFSLYIFAPHYTGALDITVSLISVLIVTLITQGRCGKKRFAKIALITFFVTQFYSGAMLLVYLAFSPSGIAVFNGVVYFAVSPLLILLFTVFFYFVFSTLMIVFKSKIMPEKFACIILEYSGVHVECNGLLDTGNGAVEPFSGKPVIFVNKEKAKPLFVLAPQNKMRMIPFDNISESGRVFGFEADVAQITAGGKKYIIGNPVIAPIDNGLVNSEYDAIINPEILEYAKETVKI